MVSLKDRHFCCPKICENCINSFCIEIIEDDGAHDEYFCLIGLSPEDLQIISDEMNTGYATGLFSWNHEYSEQFEKIMGFAESTNIFDSERYVRSDDCCNLYKGRFNEEKNNEEC